MTQSLANMVANVIRNDLCAFSHRSFLELHPHTPFHPNWHHAVICAALERVAYGQCRRLIITLPPRHLKSHIASVAFPAFVLGHFPWLKILSVTYGQDLSDNLARTSRKLMMSPFYGDTFETRVSAARDAVADFETTKGGNRLSTSVGGPLTGRGADIIIIDDPLKADDALSDLRRQAVHTWYDNTLRSRLNSQEEGAIVIIMQRLHADDLIAHVQRHERWEVVSLPAIAEKDEVHEISTHFGRERYFRKVGEALHPALLSRDTLESHRQAMTDYNFAAQYQQNPQPPSGLIVRREWLRYYTHDEKPEQFDFITQVWDTANKATELSNFSVCLTAGLKDGKVYLLDAFRKKMEFPELKRTVKFLASFHKARVVLIEDKASGTSLLQELRAERFSEAQAAPAIEGEKVLRLRSQTAKIEGGLFLLPKEAPWLDDYVLELITFPNSKYDDQVDATVYLLAWMTENSTRLGWTVESLDRFNNMISNIMSGAMLERRLRGF